MITFTDTARERFQKVIDDAGDDCAGLRVRAHKVGNHTFRYQLHLAKAEDIGNGDVALDMGSFTAYVDSDTAEWMKDATIDFVEDVNGCGFDIDNPVARVKWDDPVAQKVQDVIDASVMPTLASHGGWCELIEVKNGAAHVQLGGGCQGCAGARATLKMGIETMIKREVPEVTEVVDETDHSAGGNPFMHGCA